MEPLAESVEHGESSSERAGRIFRMAIATALLGVGTGFIGIFIALLIRHVQVIGLGDAHGGFLEIATHAPPWRRFLSVTLGGCFGAVAWYWLRGVEPGIVSVEDSLKGKRMPPLVTLVNGVIQDIVVALGGSFGREAAPREIAAMWGNVLGDGIGVTKEQRKVLVACGTGAGLAAVYSVPISGVLYTIEHVLNWDTSPSAVLPAIVTSGVATVVASVAVDTDGLYAMPLYSYDWPSRAMLLWAALIGPLAGISAVIFRRLVKAFEHMKPVARLPVLYKNAVPGTNARLLVLEETGPVRREAVVTSKSVDGVTVRFAGLESDEKTYDKPEWIAAKPEGLRDWKILIVMPTTFVILGILAHDFPTLLGNGRALAEVAIHRQRTFGVFVILLILKALMTASSIGSGAAGGTLTPSVAIGATLGAIAGETFQYFCPAWAPLDDAPMAVVAAAAFLGVAMRSPVTSVWLLIEFSAQGVMMADILLMFRGDFSGILRSKLGIGMLLPTAISVALATATVTACTTLWEYIERTYPMPEWNAPSPYLSLSPMAGGPGALGSLSESCTVCTDIHPDASRAARRRSSLSETASLLRSRTISHDLDLRDSRDSDDYDDDFEADGQQGDASHFFFQAGLLLNTFLTVGVASAFPNCQHVVAMASMSCIPLAAVFGALLACWRISRLSRRSSRAATDAKTGVLHFQESLSTSCCKCDSLNDVLSLCRAMFLTVVGAIVPTAPWTLNSMRDSDGTFTALAASFATAVAATAGGAAVDQMRVQSGTPKLICKQVSGTILVAVAATILGMSWAQWGPALWKCSPQLV